MTAPPTIADIAARAGCSKSTVARVLNDRPDVNSETRARIRAIMEELAFSRTSGRGRSRRAEAARWG